jgi:tetratricopeptide (TPR) repeat protein
LTDLQDRVTHLLDIGRGDEALALLTKHLGAHPDDWYALCQLAWAHHVRDDSAAMSDAADAAVGAAPDQEWAHRLASVAALWRGDRAKALRHAKEAVRLAPENWHARHSLSRALLEMRQKQAAHEEAHSAVRLAPLEAQAHLQLSVAADACRYREEADAALQRALELNPHYGQALNVKAARELRKRKLGRAAASMIDALRLDPQSEVGHENLAALMAALLFRLYGVTVLCCIAVAIMLFAGRSGAIPPYWPRAAAGLVFIGLIVGVGWLTVRHVPATARRRLASLPRLWRGRRLVAPVVFGTAALCLIVIAFLPSDIAFAVALVGGGALIVLFRIFQGAFIIWVVFAAGRAGFRFARRLSGRGR